MRRFPLAAAIGSTILAVAVPFALASVDAGGDLPVLAGAKMDRLPSASCADQDWPYVSGPCLGGSVPVRVVPITGSNTTALVR